MKRQKNNESWFQMTTDDTVRVSFDCEIGRVVFEQIRETEPIRALVDSQIQQKDPGPWFKMQMLADGTAEIEILAEIGFWGVTAEEFKAELDAIRGAPSIRLLINSPGGDVSDGIALYNLLSGVRSKLTVEVVGIAASAASLVALSGSKMIMGEGAFLMIHEPWGITMGTAADMLSMAETLEKMTGQFAAIYSKRSDLSEDEVLDAMAAETWYTADEAVEAGFADKVMVFEEKAAALSLSSVKQQVLESMINMKLEVSRLKRETEGTLRDAGLSQSTAKSETARIFSDHRDGECATQSDSEAGHDVLEDDEGTMLGFEALRARTTTLRRQSDE